MKDHGTAWDAKAPLAFTLIPKERAAVCFMDNAAFQALAFAFSLKEFKRLRDGRPDGQWFTVPKSDLRSIVPGGARMKELK